jgi:hypothetical protein
MPLFSAKMFYDLLILFTALRYAHSKANAARMLVNIDAITVISTVGVVKIVELANALTAIDATNAITKRIFFMINTSLFYFFAPLH